MDEKYFGPYLNQRQIPVVPGGGRPMGPFNFRRGLQAMGNFAPFASAAGFVGANYLGKRAYDWISGGSSYSGRTKKRKILRTRRPFKRVAASKRKYKKAVRRRGRKKQMSLRNIYKQVRELRRLTKMETGVQVIRDNDSGTISGAVNTKTAAQATWFDGAIADALGDDVYRHNWDDVGSVFERTSEDIRGLKGAGIKILKGSWVKYTYANNTTIPCTLEHWLMTPKERTGDAPFTSISDGITDLIADGGTYDVNNPLTNFKDSPHFRWKWKVLRKETRVLNPGNSVTFFQRITPHVHKFDMYDEETGYRPGIALWSVTRIHGAIAHDTTNTTTEVGYAACQLDWVREHCYRFIGMNQYNCPTLQYGNAGLSNLDAFSNAATIADEDQSVLEVFDS